MVVTDGHLFPPSDMKVRIISWDGRDTVADLQREWTVDKVKIVAMEHFLRPSDCMKTSLYHKLLHVRLSKCLSEELTLGQEGVKENDELLLLKRRLPPSAFETSDRQQKEDRRTPDMATIRKMTSHLPKNDYSAKEEEPINSVDFQTELRRILISLIEASQRILCLNPSAAKIFKQAEEMLSEPLPQPKIDQSALRQLTDMGFPEPRAKKALILNKMAVMAAMDWLFQNENDPDIDTPLPELQDPPPSTSSAQPAGAEGQETTSPEVRASGELPHFTNILDTIRAFKKREFRPNPRALQRLIEMGFGETQSVEALRMFRNDQDAACDWLLGERRERGVVVEEGLDPSSLVYQAIMNNPTVQLGLSNPRCLLAFLQMLENPMAANQWLNDPETGPILMQVSRIYQMRLDGDRTPTPTPLDTPTTATTPTSRMGELLPLPHHHHHHLHHHAPSPVSEGASFSLSSFPSPPPGLASALPSSPPSPPSVPPASTSLSEAPTSTVGGSGGGGGGSSSGRVGGNSSSASSPPSSSSTKKHTSTSGSS